MADAQLEQWGCIDTLASIKVDLLPLLPLLGTIKTKFPSISLNLIAAGKVITTHAILFFFFPRAHTSIN